MKTLLLFITLALSLFGATVYKSPAFVVQNSDLFCTDYYGTTITTKPVGSIISSDVAIEYCSYTYNLTIEKQKLMQTTHSFSKDQATNITIYLIIGFLILVVCSLIFFLF